MSDLQRVEDLKITAVENKKEKVVKELASETNVSHKLFSVDVVPKAEGLFSNVILKSKSENKLSISKIRLFDGESTELELAPGEEIIDDQVLMGRRYSFEYTELHESGPRLIGSIEVRVPMNLKIDSLVSVLDYKDFFVIDNSGRSIFTVDRLILEKEGLLITEGTHLILYVTELIGNGGSIQSFQKGSVAADFTPGRSGGLLELQVEKGLGELSVIMRGEHGGLGDPGPKVNPKIKGPAGKDGHHKGEYRQFLGGVFSCVHPPGNGHQGGTGPKGNTGLVGNRGGDSGIFMLTAPIMAEFSVKVLGVTGVGGQGGHGSQGGPPGPPGKGGNITFVNLKGGRRVVPPREQEDFLECRSRPGEKGKYGPYGDRGPHGAQGTLLQTCFRENSSSAQHCRPLSSKPILL